MMYKKKLILFLAAFLATFSVSAQSAQPNVDSLASQRVLAYVKRAMRFSRFYPQEKVYLHLDNNGYFKGETIWFKAYVTRGDTEGWTDLSRVLYVELVNPSGDVVERRKLRIEDGEAQGDIRVDSILGTGFYEIRAYTRYMTNWGTNACFSRVIPIFKAPKTEGDYSSPTIDKLSYAHRLNNERLGEGESDPGNVAMVAHGKEKAGVAEGSLKKNQSAGGTSGSARVRFFPEGGRMVDGLPCRVAFTVADRDGLPMEAECDVVDADGNVLQTLRTDRWGRGVVSLPANGGAKGIAVRDGKKRGKVVRLPERETSGCALVMDMTRDDSVRVEAFVSSDIVGEKLGYVVMHGGVVIRCDTLTAASGMNFAFNRAKLPEGVSQFTLFDSSGKVMAERLFFILGNEATTTATGDSSSAISSSKTSSSIKIDCATKEIRPCGKVTFNIQTAPNASISFSALDCKTTVNGSAGNIRTWMLMGSELRGYIAEPEYFLEADDEEHRAAADRLMMVQGWRRYDWRLCTGEAMFGDMQPIEDGLRIYGKVKGTTKRKSVENVELKTTLFKRGADVLEGEMMTDSLGRYSFDVPDIEGEWNLQIASKYKEKAAEYRIGIDRNFTPRARYVSPEETRATPVDDSRAFRWKTAMEDEEIPESITRKNHVLKNVTVKAKGRVWDRTGWSDETDARLLSMIFYNCDAAMDRIEDEGDYAPSVAEWLKEKNSFFSGNNAPDDILIYRAFDDQKENPIDTVKALYDWFSAESEKYMEYEQMPPAPDKKFYRDGLSYKNRPVVWIIDNMFVTITNFRMKGRAMHMPILYSDNYANSTDLPITLDELKSVYISEDPRSMLSHIRCQEIEDMNPVVLYCYTHRRSPFHQKGTRYTHFDGFNAPSVFQMEDYSVLPPMPDFRRTLYWNPSVRTGADGKARVEFYNNDTCTEMLLSAEGLTEDGRAVAY